MAMASGMSGTDRERDRKRDANHTNLNHNHDPLSLLDRNHLGNGTGAHRNMANLQVR